MGNTLPTQTLKSFSDLPVPAKTHASVKPALIHADYVQDGLSRHRVFDLSQNDSRKAFLKFCSWAHNASIGFTITHNRIE